MSEYRIVYEGFYGDRRIAFDLTEEDCRNHIINSVRYGNPTDEYPYALGVGWSNSEWNIRSREVMLHLVAGELKGNPETETAHVCWFCPLCGRWYSDDSDFSLDSPYLTICSCGQKGEGHYLLIQFGDI
ncbi:MAG: hypothetical protein CMJ46_14975 [Planctomyces sp.]|nr:hypothetical protein [Planctomyces sp.]